MNDNNFIPDNNNEIDYQNYFTNNNISSNYPNIDELPSKSEIHD